MKKKNFLRIIKVLAITAMGFLFVACGNGEDTSTGEGDTENTLNVVSSFSILTDMIEEIGGEYVSVHNLVPIGTDPHEYEPLPEDIKAATDADLLLYNGLNLEGGENGWFFKLANSVGKTEESIFEASEDVEPMYLADEEGNQEVNPHAFLSPKVGIQMTENIREALVEQMPENAEYFEQSAADYLERLNQIDTEYTEGIGSIPEENRVFIASEQAFQYMTNEYGLKEGYIWAIDTDENGSPDQIRNAIEFVNKNQPNVLFIESNVDRRPMETISAETGVDIYERAVLSDEIAKPGEEGDSYIEYLEYNLDVIINGLTE
ncbi:MAG TPA: zinc ABC transporter substrate-binding protein [Atopostipes sp.]|nr:zinc ABC transporter substrate-binding protein [Atopostipes sp.]